VTRVQGGGTSGEPQERTAAVWFAGIMALAFGGAGVLIAALAVGIERTWSGGAEERSRAGERGRGWLGEQRDWLAADHRQRLDQNRRRRDWLASGADPATEPAKPGRSGRLRNGIRRALANAALGAADFVAGARDGWRAAQESRRNGGRFRDIVKARPAACRKCRRTEIALVADELCLDCDRARNASAGDEDGPTGPRPVKNPEQLKNFICRCSRCNFNKDGFQTQEAADATLREHWKSAHSGADAKPTTPPAPDSTPETPDPYEEEPMPDPAQNSAAPAESNAKVLGVKLNRIHRAVTTQVDDVDGIRGSAFSLFVRTREVADFANNTGQSARSLAATDAAAEASSKASGSLQQVRDQLEAARDSLAKAIEAQQVIARAEEALRAEGADHRAVAQAPA
jgi:ElaB/YqjD/DUF883 family membrane-anchored ribosome-binding protein